MESRGNEQPNESSGREHRAQFVRDHMKGRASHASEPHADEIRGIRTEVAQGKLFVGQSAAAS